MWGEDPWSPEMGFVGFCAMFKPIQGWEMTYDS